MRFASFLVLVFSVLMLSCVPQSPCCTVPQFVDTPIALSWTIDGEAAASACERVGAVTAQLDVLAEREQRTTIPCSAGVSVVNATVFLPAFGDTSAGVLLVTLLDQSGAVITARRVGLAWRDGSVSAAVALVTADPAGSVRYQWCQPLRPGTALSITADGPMWTQASAADGATEVLFPALAPGTYTFSDSYGSTGVGPAVDVSAGSEATVRVYPCPLAP